MKIPPLYVVNSEMLELLSKIHSIKSNLESDELPLELIKKIRGISLLRSALFSARIEGNSLTLQEAEQDSGEVQQKKELYNIQKADHYLHTKVKKGKLTKNILSELHVRVMSDISADAGHIRTEMSAIFNQAGVAVYVAPAPTNVPLLLDELFDYINRNKEQFSLVIGCVAHLIFEKIHPFLDGNGRVGRLLIPAVLQAKGWESAFGIPFEQYLDEHKDEYYHYLNVGMEQADDYITFMLQAFLSGLEELDRQIEAVKLRKTSFLPPRQEEIYTLIKEHTALSFDMIQRRFLRVPGRTLRYDLKKLADNGLIEKTGTTKGSYYRVQKILIKKLVT